MKNKSKVVVWYCANTTEHVYYEVSKEHKPNDEHCPYCKKFLKMKAINNNKASSKENKHKVQIKNSNSKICEEIVSFDNNEQGVEVKSEQLSSNSNNVVNVNNGSISPKRIIRDKKDRKDISCDFNENIQKTVVIEKMVNDCFVKNDVYGMDDIKSKLNQLYYVFNNENTQEMLGKKQKIDTTIKNKHFFISGNRRCGKFLLTKTLTKLLSDLSIREEEIKELNLRPGFQNIIKNNDKDEIEKFFENCDDKVVCFDACIDEMFIDRSGKINIDMDSAYTIRDIMNKYAGKFTLVFKGSELSARELFSCDERIKEGCILLSIGDYKVDDAIRITEKVFRDEYGKVLATSARHALCNRIKRTSFDREYSLGNFILDVYEEAHNKQSIRMAMLDNKGKYASSEERSLFIESDVMERKFDEERLEKLLIKLDSMVGLNAVKKEIHKQVNRVKHNRKILEEGGKPINLGFMNMLFLGNPGTGKSTIVKLVADIYYSMGILKKNKVFSVSIQDLTDIYENSSSKETQKWINAAKGGVLFIDEAYSLMDNDKNKTANEVLSVIVDQSSKHKNDLMIIMAGYTEEVNKFIKLNPGAPSRFPNKIIFEDYTVEEMTQIFYFMASENNIEVEKECEKLVRVLLKKESQQSDFGNGRGVEETLKKVCSIVSDRVMQHSGEKNKSKNMIMKQDLMSLVGSIEDDENIENVLKKLNSMIGLKNAKEQIEKIFNYVNNQNRLKKEGKNVQGVSSYNLRFVGPPGTGKTTVAKIIAKIYQKLGVLKYNDVFIECKGSADLVDDKVGGTAKKVKEKIKEAEGGILFIDEAYSIAEVEKFGKQAIDTLCSEIDGRGGELVVIIAGYEEDINNFLDINDGMPSRFPFEIRFDEYSENELVDIFKYQVEEKGYKLDSDLDEYLLAIMKEERRKKDFSNARTVRNLVDKCTINIADRTQNENNIDELTIIRQADLPMVESYEEETIESLLKELNSMIGLEEVKQKIKTILEFCKYNDRREKSGKNKIEMSSYNLRFIGPPGTGKTTVAKIIGKIYQRIGILRKDTFVECKGKEMLVADHVGGTVKKTKEILRKARGGVLFIDEAYDLMDNGVGGYGKEAINALCSEIDERGDELMVIIAGYPEDISMMLSENPGMESRFPDEIVFKNYTLDELVEIFKYKILKKGLKLHSVNDQKIKEMIGQASKKENFGNARGVSGLADRMIEIIAQKSKNRQDDCLDYIYEEDIDELMSIRMIREKV